MLLTSISFLSAHLTKFFYKTSKFYSLQISDNLSITKENKPSQMRVREIGKMYSLVPENMYEVEEKLTYLLEKGIETTEEDVIREAVRDNSQQILDGDLEGPYWKVEWQSQDKTLAIFDIMNKEVGTVTSLSDSFIEDFRTNAPNLIRHLAEKIQRIVNTN